MEFDFAVAGNNMCDSTARRPQRNRVTKVSLCVLLSRRNHKYFHNLRARFLCREACSRLGTEGWVYLSSCSPDVFISWQATNERHLGVLLQRDSLGNLLKSHESKRSERSWIHWIRSIFSLAILILRLGWQNWNSRDVPYWDRIYYVSHNEFT